MKVEISEGLPFRTVEPECVLDPNVATYSHPYHIVRGPWAPVREPWTVVNELSLFTSRIGFNTTISLLCMGRVRCKHEQVGESVSREIFVLQLDSFPSWRNRKTDSSAKDFKVRALERNLSTSDQICPMGGGQYGKSLCYRKKLRFITHSQSSQTEYRPLKHV